MFDDLHGAGQTIILVTHEDHIAAHAHRSIRLRDGKIESDILSSDELLSDSYLGPVPAEYEVGAAGAA